MSLNTEQAARNLISPLRQLGLIDAEGKPTALANDWRSNDKYSQTCRQMIETVYPQNLRDLFADKDSDKKKIEDWFQYTASLGQGTAKQAATFYRLLLEAEPKSSTDATTSSPRQSAKTASPKAPKVSQKPQKKTSSSPENPTPLPVAAEQVVASTSSEVLEDAKNWFSLHIDLQIHISPEADAEQIDNIFASMAKQLSR